MTQVDNQQLSNKVAQLAEAIALEIRQIKDDASGPALFEHISRTLDFPPTVRETTLERKAGSQYMKTIVLDMQWKRTALQKRIVLLTNDFYQESDLDIPDEMYNVFIPYLSAIYAEGDTPGVFDVLICRKSYE